MFKIFGTSEETKNDSNNILIDETEEILLKETKDKKEAIEKFKEISEKMKNNKLFKSENNPIIYICLKEDKKIIKEKSIYKIKKKGKLI